MPPATATAANAMKPATGPVIDCWICCSGPSHGRLPPPEAKAGSESTSASASAAAKPLHAINKVVVQLGDRDERRGDYPVRAGIADGDRILRNPNAQLGEGQLVELAKPGGAAPDLATSGGTPAAASATATK